MALNGVRPQPIRLLGKFEHAGRNDRHAPTPANLPPFPRAGSTLELVNTDGDVIASNNNSRDIAATTIPPPNDLEAASCKSCLPARTLSCAGSRTAPGSDS